MGAREGKKREILAPPALWAPHPSSSTLPAPPFGRRPTWPQLFLGLGPNVPHFIILLICSFFVHFFCFHFLSFFIFLIFSLFCFCWYFSIFEKKTFLNFFIFPFFQVGREGRGRQTQTPNLFPVWGGGDYPLSLPPSLPNLKLVWGLGGREGVTARQTQTP